MGEIWPSSNGTVKWASRLEPRNRKANTATTSVNQGLQRKGHIHQHKRRSRHSTLDTPHTHTYRQRHTSTRLRAIIGGRDAPSLAAGIASQARVGPASRCPTQTWRAGCEQQTRGCFLALLWLRPSAGHHISSPPGCPSPPSPWPRRRRTGRNGPQKNHHRMNQNLHAKHTSAREHEGRQERQQSATMAEQNHKKRGRQLLQGTTEQKREKQTKKQKKNGTTTQTRALNNTQTEKGRRRWSERSLR